ncbi:hypothetical protein FC10_GL000796 [Lactobacillus delbrueckii subsp. lactis DSM 20072]|nr:hypothetical protein FC10_GL000796 [Lactobacillus delbrueckii subsp. lactis DSM 20072]
MKTAGPKADWAAKNLAKDPAFSSTVSRPSFLRSKAKLSFAPGTVTAARVCPARST